MHIKRQLLTILVLGLVLAAPLMAHDQSEQKLLQLIADLQNRVAALEAERSTARTAAMMLNHEGTQTFLDFIKAGKIRVEGGSTAVTASDAINTPSTLGVDTPKVFFEGVNVIVRSGSGSTGAINGLGNLIVGYNEAPSGGLNPGDRTGSHNLIVGPGHRFPNYGSFIAGTAGF